MKKFNRKLAMAFLVGLALPWIALATPSSTYWAPSTASCQSFNVPHTTYDTYFAKGAAYPIDAGLTSGILPWDKIQAEAGFDMLYPTQDPLYFNGKFCTPEASLFAGSPAISFGIYNLGIKSNVTNYDVLHIMFQKNLPFGGYFAVGAYRGLTQSLFLNSDGNTVQSGILAGANSPDVQIGLSGLKKVNFAADIQTGKNALGAWGFGTNIYFTDSVSLLTGPVFFFDKKLQPGGQDFMWTMQLDIDIFLTKAEANKKN